MMLLKLYSGYLQSDLRQASDNAAHILSRGRAASDPRVADTLQCTVLPPLFGYCVFASHYVYRTPISRFWGEEEEGNYS